MCSRSATSTRSITATSSDSTEDGGRRGDMESSRRYRSLLAALVCTGLLALVAGSPAASAAPTARASIIGGGAADPAQWPYAVAIYRKGHLHCGGSVIGPTKILT